MTRAEQEVRRKRIADAVAAGVTVAKVCRDERVSTTTVRQACKQHRIGVETPYSAWRTLDLVAAMCNHATLASIAEAENVEYAYLSKLYRRCIELGIPIKKYPRGRPKCI